MVKVYILDGTLPKTSYRTLFQTPGKPSTDHLLFRPTGLMCHDTKKLVRKISKRLVPRLPKLYTTVRMGFYKNISLHNIRKVLNIFNEKEGSKDKVVLSLNTQKTFVKINCAIFLTTRFRFGEGLLDGLLSV